MLRLTLPNTATVLLNSTLKFSDLRCYSLRLKVVDDVDQVGGGVHDVWMCDPYTIRTLSR